MFMNIKTGEWDDDLCAFFGITKAMLPEIRSSSERYGTFHDGAFRGVPLAGCLGDQQAALFGQQCYTPGQVKMTYGTGWYAGIQTLRLTDHR